MAFADAIATMNRAVLGVVGDDAITYVPSVGAPVNVKGVFDALYVREDSGRSGVVSSGPSVWVLLADLPTDPAEDLDPTVIVGGVAYTVSEPEKDGKGGVRLYLNRA